MSEDSLTELTPVQTIIYAGFGSLCEWLGKLRMKLCYGEVFDPGSEEGHIDVVLYQLGNGKSLVEVAQCLRCGEDIIVYLYEDSLHFMVRSPDEEIVEQPPENAPPDWASKFMEGWIEYPDRRGMFSYGVLSWVIKRIGFIRDWAIGGNCQRQLSFMKSVGCSLFDFSPGEIQDGDAWCPTCGERYGCALDGVKVRLSLRCPLSFREAMSA